MLHAGQAYSNEVSLNADVVINARHNDNIKFSAANKETVTGGNLNPGIDLKVSSPGYQFGSSIEVDLARYKNRPDLKREEGAFTIDWLNKSERSTFKVFGTLIKQSSLNEQLDVVGILDDQVYRNTGSFSSSWEYQVSKSSGVVFNYFYTDVSFEEPGYYLDIIKIANFFDYTQQAVSTMLFRSLTEKDMLKLTLAVSDYEGHSNGLSLIGFLGFYQTRKDFAEYKTKTLKLAYQYDFSKQQQVSFTLGRSTSDIYNVQELHAVTVTGADLGVAGDFVSEDERVNTVFDLEYSYALEASQFSASLDKSVTDDVTGELIEKSQFNFGYDKRFTERSSFGVDLRAMRNSSITSSITGSVNDRSTAALAVLLNYKLTKDWVFSMRYAHIVQEHEESGVSTDADTIHVGMTWRLPKLLSTY